MSGSWRLGVMEALVVTTCLLVAPASLFAESDAIHPSVIKIHSTQRYPNPFRPWAKVEASESSGTGFVIDGKRILTNAHVVSFASQVYVQGHGSSEKVAAKVEHCDVGIDLAVLTVADETFFDARPPLVLDDALPSVKAAVNVYGYPRGGDQISITEGIISRVEYTGFYYDTYGLRVQVDAAINPGNSGGPAISNGKVLGVAFQGLNDADNIGYLIAAEEVRRFLEDVQDGKYDGKPRLWDQFQTTDNEDLRADLKLRREIGGCMVTSCASGVAGGVLQEKDVVTHVGPHAIGHDGYVRADNALPLWFNYYVDKLGANGTVPLTIVRDGETKQVNAPIAARRARVTPYLEQNYPPYFIIGPLVFSTPVTDLLEYSKDQSKTRWLAHLMEQGSPLVTRRNDAPAFDGEQLVFVPSSFLPHPLTKGYSNPLMYVLDKANGVKVKNLKHLVELIRDSQEEYLEFKFAGRAAETLVFRRQSLLDATEEILSDGGIRNQCSEELRPIWEAKAGK